MENIKNPDPKIIARQTDEPVDSSTVSFDYKDKALAEKKWNKTYKFLSSKASPLKKMAAIHRIVDFAVDNMDVAKKSVCQKGCAHCCKVDVHIGLIEAMYIAKHTGLTVVDRQKPVKRDYHKEDNYCQFLDKETATCLIYEYRPVECRSFHTFDNKKFCISFEKHGIHTTASSGNIQQLMIDTIGIAGGQVCDIRDWFAEYTQNPFENVFSKDVKIMERPDVG